MIPDPGRVARDLADSAEAVCRHYLHAGHRQGRYWTVGDCRNTPGRSMWVRLEPNAAGRPAGKWMDSATGEHGDLLDVIRRTCRLANTGEAVREACRFLNLPPDIAPFPAALLPDRQPASASLRAARLFASARPLRRTPAERYLAARGLGGAAGETALRYHANCYCRLDDGQTLSLPAMIAAVTCNAGRITGVLRTWLDPASYNEATLGKARIDTPRKAMGHLLGHAVRLGLPEDVLAAGEGIETVLSLQAAVPKMPAAAALTAAHLAAFIFPPGLRQLYIVRDNDAGGHGAASRLRDRARDAGIETAIIAAQGNDLNDDLRGLGLQGLLDTVREQLTGPDRIRFLSPARTMR